MNILPDIDPFRQRYNELEAQLSDIFKDGKLATEISKEHVVKNILTKLEDLQNLNDQLIQSQELLSEEEFADIAREDIDLIESKIEKLSNELIISMLPQRPAVEETLF